MGVFHRRTVRSVSTRLTLHPHRRNATLQTLNLKFNQIGHVGAAAIGEGLRCVYNYHDYACSVLFVSFAYLCYPVCAVVVIPAVECSI